MINQKTTVILCKIGKKIIFKKMAVKYYQFSGKIF